MNVVRLTPGASRLPDQAALDLGDLPTDEASMRAAFMRAHLDMLGSFEEAMAIPSVRICLRNIVAAQLRALAANNASRLTPDASHDKGAP